MQLTTIVIYGTVFKLIDWVLHFKLALAMDVLLVNGLPLLVTKIKFLQVITLFFILLS